MTTSSRVALLGLGTMGSGMAQNLLKSGFHLSVYNRTPSRAEPLAQAGARVAHAPAAAVSDADLVLTMLADDDASRDLLLGSGAALAHMKPGAILVECSTVTPAWIAELAAAAKPMGIRLLDAPVTGSRLQAEQGQLNFLVGGETGDLEEVRPILESMSKSITHLGPLSSGARMKLINNFLCGVQMASLAEGLAWMERSGLDRGLALDVLKNGAPGSPLLVNLSTRMVDSNFGVNFLLSLMDKDMRYAAADASQFGVDLRTGTAADSRLQDALTAGLGDKDMSAVIEPIRSADSRSSR